MASNAIEPAEVVGVRDVLLAPVETTTAPKTAEFHQALLFDTYESRMRRADIEFRRWSKRVAKFSPDILWKREDVAAGRHMRYRRLHDSVSLAQGESCAGQLPLAIAFAQQAQRLGDEGEPMRDIAHDLELLCRAASGADVALELLVFDRLARPTGLSPLGTWEALHHLMPLLTGGTLATAATLMADITSRFGSPRGELQAQSWRVAAELMASPQGTRPSELPALLSKSRHAPPGLRMLPVLLDGIAYQRQSAFEEAERLARAVGSVWAQTSALTWMTATNPRHDTARWLHRLLDVSGWRRPSLVPPHVAADAALGLLTAGRYGRSVIELAAAAGRPNVTFQVAIRHCEDSAAPPDSRLVAIEALKRLGTTQSREALHRLAQRTDEVGAAARTYVATRAQHLALSEREIEVLDLAGHGLTNREIADRLVLSPHTVARHLANARTKLGAANRTEAAHRLAELR